MNKFFFDVRHGDEVLADAVGTECADAQVAVREAMIALGEMARDEVAERRWSPLDAIRGGRRRGEEKKRRWGGIWKRKGE